MVAVGTGQALRNAQNGDGDVVLVHATASEESFVAAGHGVARHDVMYNEFVVVGPAADPAGVTGSTDVVAAFERIASVQAVFLSRGDDSGTHQAERRFWSETPIDVAEASGSWYRETGAGMGATLNMGTAMGAYVMTDRATWAAFGNKGGHTIVVEGDPRLINQYGVIRVNPDKHPHVRADLGQMFIEWILSADGQATIASFEIDGQQVFFPNARK